MVPGPEAYAKSPQHRGENGHAQIQRGYGPPSVISQVPRSAAGDPPLEPLDTEGKCGIRHAFVLSGFHQPLPSHPMRKSVCLNRKSFLCGFVVILLIYETKIPHSLFIISQVPPRSFCPLSCLLIFIDSSVASCRSFSGYLFSFADAVPHLPCCEVP